jgi:hypothetical protein
MEFGGLYKDPASDAAEEFSGLKEIVAAHLSAPPKQQVPSRFLALVRKWKELRETWLRETLDKLDSLRAGIDRLKEAGQRVAKLEEEATKQRQELEVGSPVAGLP